MLGDRDAVLRHLRDRQRCRHRIAAEGPACAALVPMDEREIPLPGLVDPRERAERMPGPPWRKRTTGLAQLAPVIVTNCSIPPIGTKPASRTEAIPSHVRAAAGACAEAGMERTSTASPNRA